MTEFDARPRVRAPREASAGEVINIRTIITHPMHNGVMVDAEGETIPRHIIYRFTCEFDGEMILDMDIGPSVSTNPYIEFHAQVPRSGTFEFTWYDDNGSVYTESSEITVA